MKYVLWLAGVVAALVIVWYLWVSKGTPTGQPPLTSLKEGNLDRFRSDFNSASNDFRLLLLLSPT